MLATSSTTEPIRAETVRSGLVESTDTLTGCLVDRNGNLLVGFGDIERPLFYRSAIKPFQAKIALEFGADLPAEHLAVACSSHTGLPVHRAIVRSILDHAGLDETDLQTPPAWPTTDRATRLLVATGTEEPRPIFNNCSGKHAAWLAACAASGHDTTTYLDPAHPLQHRIRSYVADLTGLDPEPTGVDGCGAPTLRGNVLGLARAFARLDTDPELARVKTACSRFPALVAGNDVVNGRLGQWWPSPVKGGAEGLMACAGNGFAAAVKSHSGSYQTATAALAEMLAGLGLLSAAARAALSDVLARPVVGGGRTQGTVRILVPA